MTQKLVFELIAAKALFHTKALAILGDQRIGVDCMRSIAKLIPAKPLQPK